MKARINSSFCTVPPTGPNAAGCAGQACADASLGRRALQGVKRNDPPKDDPASDSSTSTSGACIVHHFDCTATWISLVISGSSERMLKFCGVSHRCQVLWDPETMPHAVLSLVCSGGGRRQRSCRRQRSGQRLILFLCVRSRVSCHHQTLSKILTMTPLHAPRTATADDLVSIQAAPGRC